MARKVTVDGIEIDIAFDPEDDYQLFAYTMTFTDPESSGFEASKAIDARNRLVLGEKYEEALSAIRKKNGGKLPVAEVNKFVAKVINKAVELKN